jgi:hypothetical protein
MMRSMSVSLRGSSPVLINVDMWSFVGNKKNQRRLWHFRNRIPNIFNEFNSFMNWHLSNI